METINFNAEQQAVLNSKADRILVAAGPGSGKTRVLVAKVAQAAAEFGAGACCVVTFTNAAAQEMAGRLEKMGVKGLGHVGTLHALCLRMAREHPEALGLPQNIGVVDDDQRLAILETVRSELGVKCSEKKALELLEASNGADPFCKPPTKESLLVVEYHRRLRNAGLLDFDMLLKAGLDYVKLCKEGGAEWPFKALLWDEGQDSAAADFDILEAMPCEKKFVCGDSDQSIFQFRGADVDRFNRMALMFGGWTLFVLETNYRSGDAICDHAQKLIEHNAGRVPKRTRAVRKGGAVEAHRCETPADELGWVLERVRSIVQGKADWVRTVERGTRDSALLDQAEQELETAYKDVVVLARTNRLAEAFAAHLAANGVPVRRAKQRQEPADWRRTKLLLTVLDNPWNDFAVLQLLKADGEDVKQVKALAGMEMVGVNELLKFRYGKGGGLSVDVDLARHGVSPESRERVHDAARELGKSGEWTVPDLLLYLHAKEGAVEEVGEGVVCTTVHAMKGREARHVIVVGMEEGAFPMLRKDTDISEERRLAFVAVTRAMETLALTWCAARPSSRGPNLPPGPMEPKQPSRFISEMGLLL